MDSFAGRVDRKRLRDRGPQGGSRPLLRWQAGGGALPYLKNLGLTFPILLDPDATTAGAWRVTGIPATFLIRPGGDVVDVAMGAREWNSREMRAPLDTLLPTGHPHR